MIVCAATILLGSHAAVAGAADGIAQELRICLDTGPNHLRNIAVRLFAERLTTSLPGRFHVRIFDSGQLYNDRDATKALIWGDMEMALPAVTQLARFEPAANVTALPMFYGLPPRVLADVLNESIGPDLASLIEARLPVVVLAPSLDLGYVHIFSTNRPLRQIGDVAGLKVRVFGGAVNLQRLKAQGANPIVIPWADTPLALSQGNIDAIASTYETLESASLWDAGIGYGIEERAMFIQYVPIIRRSFWDTLDLATQKQFAEVWREVSDSSREFSVHRQERAKSSATSHGVELTVPDQAILDRERTRLLTIQKEMIRKLRIPKDMVRRAEASIEASRSRQAIQDE